VWRVAFKLFPEDGVDQVNIRLYLKLRGLRVSETWDYLWETPAVQS
jgi:glucans biosynthesis protein